MTGKRLLLAVTKNLQQLKLKRRSKMIGKMKLKMKRKKKSNPRRSKQPASLPQPNLTRANLRKDQNLRQIATTLTIAATKRSSVQRSVQHSRRSKKQLLVVSKDRKMQWQRAPRTIFALQFAVSWVTSILEKPNCWIRSVKQTSKKAKQVVSLSRLVLPTSQPKLSRRRLPSWVRIALRSLRCLVF